MGITHKPLDHLTRDWLRRPVLSHVSEMSSLGLSRRFVARPWAYSLLF